MTRALHGFAGRDDAQDARDRPAVASSAFTQPGRNQCRGVLGAERYQSGNQAGRPGWHYRPQWGGQIYLAEGAELRAFSRRERSIESEGIGEGYNGLFRCKNGLRL